MPALSLYGSPGDDHAEALPGTAPMSRGVPWAAPAAVCLRAGHSGNVGHETRTAAKGFGLYTTNSDFGCSLVIERQSLLLEFLLKGGSAVI